MAIRADDVDLDRDRALVRQFQAGDDTAFDELYRCYHDRLERFCLKRVGDQHAAEEVAQEAFTRALIALPSLDGDRRFYPWVSVIASRLCTDHHRRQTRSEPISDPDPGPVSGGQEKIVEAVDSMLAVAALARLAPRHQDVLQRREVEGWSYQRIADHYGVRVGTVETLLFRARRALRREFHVVDGAGLAAIPLFGRLIDFAARIRDRLDPLATIGGASSAVAAAATAAAAAVALAVVPGTDPVAIPTPPPAAVGTPAAPIDGARPGSAGSATTAPIGPGTKTVGTTATTAGPLAAPPADASPTRQTPGALDAVAPAATTTVPTRRLTGTAPHPIGATTTVAGGLVAPPVTLTVPGVDGGKTVSSTVAPLATGPLASDAVVGPFTGTLGGVIGQVP